MELILKYDHFNSRVSRKVCYTNKSKTLKYDVKLLSTKKKRAEEIMFIKKTIYKYLTHESKIKGIDELEVKIRGD